MADPNRQRLRGGVLDIALPTGARNSESCSVAAGQIMLAESDFLLI